MSNELGIHARLPVHFFLEGKDNQHLGHESANLLDPSFAPRPHLWTDVVNNRNAGILYALRKPEIKVGKIDKNGRSGRFRFDSFRQTAKYAVQDAQRTDHLEGP